MSSQASRTANLGSMPEHVGRELFWSWKPPRELELSDVCSQCTQVSFWSVYNDLRVERSRPEEEVCAVCYWGMDGRKLNLPTRSITINKVGDAFYSRVEAEQSAGPSEGILRTNCCYKISVSCPTSPDEMSHTHDPASAPTIHFENISEDLYGRVLSAKCTCGHRSQRRTTI
ncbi:hypothetical protein BDY19DRAFT_92789 [Irpex rosettiformis]|uniref:Uncharacterized protein n=1 Tax=Irpex rosettiformis TaxID=378272 RepID=A0ACB8U7I6_9APHY|nr:hypothetical protein BDY19DRAFT_92789 [Irpex rosettiformis]